MSPYEEFARVFSKFASAEELTGAQVEAEEAEAEEEAEEATKVCQLSYLTNSRCHEPNSSYRVRPLTVCSLVIEVSLAHYKVYVITSAVHLRFLPDC